MTGPFLCVQTSWDRLLAGQFSCNTVFELDGFLSAVEQNNRLNLAQMPVKARFALRP